MVQFVVARLATLLFSLQYLPSLPFCSQTTSQDLLNFSILFSKLAEKTSIALKSGVFFTDVNFGLKLLLYYCFVEDKGGGGGSAL